MNGSTGAARAFFVIGCVFALTSVAAGAFGAHGLRQIVPPQSLVAFETAARYQMYHAFALIVVALAWPRWSGRWIGAAGVAFVIGILLFCGSLYAFVLGAPRSVGIAAPFGGIAFMVGWLALVMAAYTGRANGSAQSH